MKHPCSSVSKLLEKYLDQEVTDQEKALVEAHLFDCSSCRGALKSMEELSHVMKVPLDEIAREEEFDRVWLKVRREIRSERKHSWREVFRSWLWLPTLHQKRIWIPAVAVALVLIFVTVPLLLKKSTSLPVTFGVEYVESTTNNVMIYEVEKSAVTVIWLFEGSEAEPTTS
jgi:predicted anti-sigma-YlaC factor YlaD